MQEIEPQLLEGMCKQEESKKNLIWELHVPLKNIDENKREYG